VDDPAMASSYTSNNGILNIGAVERFCRLSRKIPAAENTAPATESWRRKLKFQSKMSVLKQRFKALKSLCYFRR
jgi:hypothetical protein